MSITPPIKVTLTAKDRSHSITFRVNTPEEKSECERLARADGAKIWEREILKW